MSKSILFISFDPVEYRRRVINQVETARETGLKVKVISTSDPKIIAKKYNFEYSAVSIPGFLKRGFLSYPVFNLILLIKILFVKFDVIHFRGLIPIPAILIRQLFNGSKLIYDAHEYFRGHQIFKDRPIRQKIWMWFEKRIAKQVETIITVCEPLADLLRNDYPEAKTVQVIRSVPLLKILPKESVDKSAVEKTAVFHGYFLPGRALENIIRAVSKIDDNRIKLMLIGEGPLENKLKMLTYELNLNDKIQFHSFIENEELIAFIRKADIGLTIIEPDCINRKYALPNKFFEYIHAGLPVLASNIPTLQTYVDKYQVGTTVDPHDFNAIAGTIMEMLSDIQKLLIWQSNCRKAAGELNWASESRKLADLYKNVAL
ncbi:MAG: glycosyltransferase [Calditrichaceae bacterium]